MRVLGIDPGLTRCGWGVVEGRPGARPTALGVGVIRTLAELDLELRLLELHAAVDRAAARAPARRGRGRAGLHPEQQAARRWAPRRPPAVAALAAAQAGPAGRAGTPRARSRPRSPATAARTRSRSPPWSPGCSGSPRRPGRPTPPTPWRWPICHVWRGPARPGCAGGAGRWHRRPDPATTLPRWTGWRPDDRQRAAAGWPRSSPDGAVVEVGGVGLAVPCTPGTLARLRVGETARLSTSLIVREDSLTLYGFADDDERSLFELLQTANGVGPRLAQAVLAVHPPREVRRAVATADVKALTQVPGHRQEGRRAADPGAAGPDRRHDLGHAFDGPPRRPAGGHAGGAVAGPAARRRWSGSAGPAREADGAIASSCRSPTSRSRRPARSSRGPAAAGAPAAGPRMSAPFDRPLTGEVDGALGQDVGRLAAGRRRGAGRRGGAAAAPAARVRRPAQGAASSSRWCSRARCAAAARRTTCCCPARPGWARPASRMIIAAELGAPVRITSGPAIERSGDLAAMLTSLAPGDVLFIDEIHRIARPAEELLYMAMEDFRVDVIVGKGPGRDRDPAGDQPVHPGRRHHPRRPADRPAARPVRLRRAHGLLRAGRAGAGAGPLRRAARGRPDRRRRRGDRRPLARHAPHRQPAAAPGPRLRRGPGRRRGRPGRSPAPRSPLYDVDDLGLDRLDRAVLDALVARFGGGPVGVGTLAVAVGEEPDTVEEVCEPFLVRAGLLARTPRGRVATAAAWRHLGRPLPRGGALLGGAGGASWPYRCTVDPGCVVRAPVRRIDFQRWRATRPAAAVRVPSGRRARRARDRGNRRTRAARTGAAPHRGAARAVERHTCRGAVLPDHPDRPVRRGAVRAPRAAAQARAGPGAGPPGVPDHRYAGHDHRRPARHRRRIGDKTIDLEIAPGVVVTFARQAILEVRQPVGTTDGVSDDGTDSGRRARVARSTAPSEPGDTDGQPLVARRPLLRRVPPDRRRFYGLIFFTAPPARPAWARPARRHHRRSPPSRPTARRRPSRRTWRRACPGKDQSSQRSRTAQRVPSTGRSPVVPGVPKSGPSPVAPSRRPHRLAHLQDRLTGERDDDAGGDLEVDGLVTDPRDGAVQAGRGHDRRTDGQGLLQGLRLGLLALALPRRQHEQHHGEQGDQDDREVLLHDRCASLPRVLLRGGCGLVGRSGTSIASVSCTARGTTGRDAHGLGRTGCAPAPRSLCAEQGL